MLPWFRERLYLVALLVCIAAIAGLLTVAAHGPGGRGWSLDQTTYTALSTIFSTLLSVGLLSLIVELFLRESYARALRRFLGLKATLVESGLVDVVSDKPSDLLKRIEGATEIKAIVRDPNAWVLAYYSSVMKAAVKRPVKVVLLFPDVDSDYFNSVAESLDFSATELRQNIELAMGALKQQWGSAGPVHSDSSIVVKTTHLPLYEIICVDQYAVCSLEASVEHRQGARRIVLVFEGDQSESTWFAEQIESASEAGEVWAADGRTPAPSRKNRIPQAPDGTTRDGKV
ncbi:hypothetical protein [Aeromicrobium phragmitis]|uniref:hypothetical protein n=1 Tax=Aeromicrobium phragmitis TaxID=2478914 RepID=UPI001061003E|nr:hypothetical protein [Aeromicrobium phragmitis]